MIFDTLVVSQCSQFIVKGNRFQAINDSTAEFFNNTALLSPMLLIQEDIIDMQNGIFRVLFNSINHLLILYPHIDLGPCVNYLFLLERLTELEC